MFNSIDQIASFAKDKGFIYPSSEIYGKFAGVYDYGYYGSLLKNNIQNAWIKEMVQKRRDIVLIDSAIFMHPTTWKASGHIDSFEDPQIDCKHCKARHRADILLEAYGINADKLPIEEINQIIEDLKKKGTVVKCPICGSVDLTQAKEFSLMVKSNLGAPTDKLSEENVVYLRAETCQGIYLNFKNVLNSTRIAPPFGIAQVGKAFRNEIIARQFVFRTREFEQMEMQYFCHKDLVKETYEEFKDLRMKWFKEYGLPASSLRFSKHLKLAHYASEAYDIEYKFNSLGDFREIEGLHARGDWDLSQHAKFSGAKLDYLDPKTNERYIPHVVETSCGLNRTLLAFIDNAYTVEALEDGSKRNVLKLDYRLSPIKVAVFPLLKNKPELVNKASEVYDIVSKDFMAEFDDNGNIGKRYRRQDEIGTPFCITVDFDTLESKEFKNTVTLRNRDTMKQDRVSIENINEFLKDNL
ncbi:MAG: glycine--tRNA ligase [Bdellovibrionota bacterium]